MTFPLIPFPDEYLVGQQLADSQPSINQFVWTGKKWGTSQPTFNRHVYVVLIECQPRRRLECWSRVNQGYWLKGVDQHSTVNAFSTRSVDMSFIFQSGKLLDQLFAPPTHFISYFSYLFHVQAYQILTFHITQCQHITVFKLISYGRLQERLQNTTLKNDYSDISFYTCIYI